MAVVNWVIIAFGLLALGYNIYDLKYPGHFVGDMYGLEVMGRLAGLFIALFPMLLGFALLALGKRKNNRYCRVGGTFCVLITTSILVSMAVYVARDRRLDSVHATYPARSIEELTRLVRQEKDSFALDALIIKGNEGDKNSVQVLKDVLEDENEKTVLRIGAFQGLTQCGDEQTKILFNKVRQETKDIDLKLFIQQVFAEREKMDRETTKGGR